MTVLRLAGDKRSETIWYGRPHDRKFQTLPLESSAMEWFLPELVGKEIDEHAMPLLASWQRHGVPNTCELDWDLQLMRHGCFLPSNRERIALEPEV